VTSPRPGARYRLFAEELRERFLAEYEPGQRLPSERDLIAESRHGRDLVRKALRILHDDGVIVIQHGYPMRMADRLPVVVVRVMRGSVLFGRRATAEERVRFGPVVMVLVDPAGRELLYSPDRVRFTFN
jgi:DNA-binding transcriptional MocR family regulator